MVFSDSKVRDIRFTYPSTPVRVVVARKCWAGDNEIEFHLFTGGVAPSFGEAVPFAAAFTT